MKLKMRNVYLTRKECLPSHPREGSIAKCSRPVRIGENLYGWNILISSKTLDLETKCTLVVDTVSQFQILSNHKLSVDYLKPQLQNKFAEFVFAAQCHHSALVINCASEFPNFNEFIPEFVSLEQAGVFTKRILQAT